MLETPNVNKLFLADPIPQPLQTLAFLDTINNNKKKT
jgi:hypothetical protein